MKYQLQKFGYHYLYHASYSNGVLYIRFKLGRNIFNVYPKTGLHAILSFTIFTEIAKLDYEAVLATIDWTVALDS